MAIQVTTRQLHAKVSEFLGRVRHGHETFIITSRGNPVAALVPIDDLDRLETDMKSIEEVTRNPEHESARRPRTAIEPSDDALREFARLSLDRRDVLVKLAEVVEELRPVVAALDRLGRV